MINDVSMPLEPASLKPGAALRILPAGVFRAYDGRPGNTEGSQISDWRMDAAIAAQVIATPRAMEGAFVIDYEHQTLNKGKNGKPAPAAGWFKKLEWREGEGLFMADIEWTEQGRAAIAAKEYRFLSPVFGFNPQTGAVTSIHSVALTNDPALIGLCDLAAATAQTHPLVMHPSLTEEDRANFHHIFGHLPGFNLP